MGIMHSELAQQVRAALEEDPQTRPAGIKVVDNNGVLTLRGSVGSEDGGGYRQRPPGRDKGVERTGGQAARTAHALRPARTSGGAPVH